MTNRVDDRERGELQPGPPDFVHLHVHSQFSLLSATSRLPDLAQAASADGQTALALTDSGNLFGAVEFSRACREKQIRPIIGMDAFVAERSRLEPSGGDNPIPKLIMHGCNSLGSALGPSLSRPLG